MTVAEFLADNGQRLVEVRRDLHAHPELSREERRTTGLLADALTHVGLSPRVMPGGTGLLCDIGPSPARIALRADLDALPIPDTKEVSYRSRVEGVAHACGHDVHSTVVLGTGLALARIAAREELPFGVRLVFQPAEEVVPGGALDVIDAGGLDGIQRIYALHCDPTVDVGEIGLRTGSITSASDHVEVRLTGPGGHTARPNLTADLVTALGAVISGAPALLARRVDPRAGVALVWGRVEAGRIANVIPRSGVVMGTLRTLSRETWEQLPPMLEEVIRAVASPYGVGVEVSHTRGVPPVVNDAASVVALDAAVRTAVEGGRICETGQSLGGEDFAWYLDHVPGALARLGVRSPGSKVSMDLHQSGFDVDERCISVGVQLLTGIAMGAGWTAA
ncbi:MAG TPA: amidohydrolase [Mycobacteriales bacterium]|nr:amidohydrolase [Mycobacteriales bacterium]